MIPKKSFFWGSLYFQPSFSHLNFLNQTPAKLKGYKRLQYLKWLQDISINPKYINVIIPGK
jgi:hypothetical protein